MTKFALHRVSYKFVTDAKMVLLTLITSAILHAPPTSSENPQFDLDFVKSPYFVDKSELLEAFFEERPGHYNFVSCPRSFGKTINIQMLKTFFNFAADSYGTVLDPLTTPAYRIIQHMKIYQNRPFIRQHFGRHPVVLLDFKYTAVGNDPPTEEAIVPWLISRIQETYVEYQWLLKRVKEDYAIWKPTISEYDLEYFDHAMRADLNSTQIFDALTVLPKMLYRYFKHSKAIILIDHYDHFQLQVDHKSQRVVDHAYRLINKILMYPFNQTYHHFWYAFGALTSAQKLPIGDEADGRLRNYVFLDDHLFSNHFGFTPEDMDVLYARHGCLLEEKLLIKKWYNGYSAWTKRKTLFQPYSVARYFQNRGSPKALQVYWPKSVPSSGVLPFFKVPEFREAIIQLMTFRKACIFVRKSRFESRHLPAFKSLSLRYDELVPTEQLHEMYTCFFENGYLGHTAKQIEFKIPNMELRQYFGKVLAHLYRTKDIPIDDIRDILIRTLHSPDLDPAMIEEHITVQLQTIFGMVSLPKFRTSNKYEYYSILHVAALEIRSVLPNITVNFKAVEGYKGDVLVIENSRVLIVSLRRVRRLEEEQELSATLNYSLPVKGITRVIFVNIRVADYGDIKTSLRDYGMDSTDEQDKNVHRDQWQDMNPENEPASCEQTSEQAASSSTVFAEEGPSIESMQPIHHESQAEKLSASVLDDVEASHMSNYKQSDSLYSLPEVE